MDSKEDKLFNEQAVHLVYSCNSLSDFKDKGYKVLVPQIAAAFITISYHIPIGISFAYSAILIPQLLEAQHEAPYVNSTDVVIKVTETDISWIASVLPTVVLPASVIGGILIDYIGRLNTLKLAAVPNAIGWILIATANNVPMLIVGRMLTGTSIALGASPAIIYTSEISTPKARGALISLGPCFISLGMMLCYLEGWFLHWRTVAWICLIYTIAPIIFVMAYVPESPTWLISKNRTEDARKSLTLLNKYRKSHLSDAQTYTEVQLKLLQRDAAEKQDQNNRITHKLKLFLDPTVYKPIFILALLYFFQQFSGLFIILFYSVSFFDAVGTNMSAYFASVLVGATRVSMSVVAIMLMKRYNRRFLIMISGVGMGLCMITSGLFTDLVKDGKTTLNWIPVAMILLYVASSMVGFLNIPWTMIGELFPTPVRGIAHSLSFGIAHVLMFASIQLYFVLTRLFGGLSGLQYFFAAMAFSGVLYSYVFLPETHNKKLTEIQAYFKNHSTYCSLKRSLENDQKTQSEVI